MHVYVCGRVGGVHMEARVQHSGVILTFLLLRQIALLLHKPVGSGALDSLLFPPPVS